MRKDRGIEQEEGGDDKAREKKEYRAMPSLTYLDYQALRLGEGGESGAAVQRALLGYSEQQSIRCWLTAVSDTSSRSSPAALRRPEPVVFGWAW